MVTSRSLNFSGPPQSSHRPRISGRNATMGPLKDQPKARLSVSREWYGYCACRGITPTSVTTVVISFGGVRSYNGFRISRLGVFSVASDLRGIEIGNVENISFDGPAGTVDELAGIPSSVS